MTPNYICNIAVVGPTGHVGSHVIRSLLATGRHHITALTRSSTTPLPSGVTAAVIDYADPRTLVAALRNQDCLIVTLSGRAPPDTQSKLFVAAAEAGVPWVLPNEWCPDISNTALTRDVPFWGKQAAARDEIVELGKSSYIGVITGFWYEWMLGIPGGYGFDLAKRELVLFDEGEVRVSTSTWAQVGRMVAALLSLPVRAEGDGNATALEEYKNSRVYVSSFFINQKDMLESVLRVTGTNREDWKITKENSKERFATGIKAFHEGDRASGIKFGTRVFFPDGSGDFEDRRINGLLGLPQESVDDATNIALERALSNPFA